MENPPQLPPYPPQQASPAQVLEIQNQLKLLGQMKGGASWFYWIAALSPINSILALTGVQWSFFAGLGITQIASYVAVATTNEMDKDYSFLVLGLGFAISIVFAVMFATFGKFAHLGHIWAFVLGMVIYALDGLIFLAFQNWPSFGFHLFALFCIFMGLKAKLAMNPPAPAPPTSWQAP